MANFTPEELEEILQQFFNVTGKRQYIGARYVPIFGRKDEDTIIWDNSAPYEPLTIVLYQGNSYTSRTYVPEGVEITNTHFWANTGNYNAQVEQYRRDTAQAVEDFREYTNEAVEDFREYTNEAVEQVNEWLTEAQVMYSKKPFAFNTVADMQAYEGLYAGAICHTNGFHASNDGGAAYYIVSVSGTANGMDVLTLKGDLYATLVVTNSYVTPEMFGAYGDNTHDDSTAINRMFASGYSKNYVLSKLEYLCEANVEITTSDNSIKGRGMFTSGIHFADDYGFVVNNTRNTIADIRFRGGTGVVCNYYHVTFTRCWFYQSDVGITLNDGFITRLINCNATFNGIGVVLNNQSYETLLSGGSIDNNVIGIVIGGNSSGPVIRDCTIEGNYNRDNGIGCGVFIASSGTRVVIDGCHFEVNGNGQDAADILAYTENSATDVSAIVSEITAKYSTTLRVGAGIVTITNSRFTYTKYGIVTGGYGLEFVITNNWFLGVLNKGNRAVLINTSLTVNKITIKDNRVRNTSNAAIDTEMLSGIKGSYVFTDATPTTAQIPALIDGTIMLDDCPLFLYKGRITDFSGIVTYTKLYSGSGTSADSGLVNGNVTNRYTGTSGAIYISTDGTSSGINIVSEAGYHEFVLVTNYIGARFNTTEIGWRDAKPMRTGVYSVNRYTLVNTNMFASDNSVVYAIIDLSEADIAKMKQCIGFEPIDLDLHEFR